MRNTRATVFRTFLEVALECSVKDGADVRKHHPVHWKIWPCTVMVSSVFTANLSSASGCRLNISDAALAML